MVTEKNSVRRTAGLAACLALSLSVGALTACGGPAPVTTTTTRSVSTETTAPAMPAQQTTTVQRTTTTNP